MNTNQGKGQTSGLHKPYFNGSPAQGKSDHPISKPPKPAIPGNTVPGNPQNPKGC